MLADVGMVKTYSKSAHVNDLGFAWTGTTPCCMDRLAPFFAWTGPTHCSYGFSARWFLLYLAGTHCTIPTSALVFEGNIFTHPHSSTFDGMQITHGPVNCLSIQTTLATKGHSLNHGRVCSTIDSLVW